MSIPLMSMLAVEDAALPVMVIAIELPEVGDAMLILMPSIVGGTGDGQDVQAKCCEKSRVDDIVLLLRAEIDVCVLWCGAIGRVQIKCKSLPDVRNR